MPHLVCISPVLAARARGCRAPWLTRGLAPVLAVALLPAAEGCREDAQSPTAPEAVSPAPRPALATATAVAALSFRQVSAGSQHSCGVTSGDRAYCWGDGILGQLGDGTTNQRLTPVAVATTRKLRQVSAGGTHTCGATPWGVAFCWGWNFYGQLGDGTTTRRLRPRPVGGGL